MIVSEYYNDCLGNHIKSGRFSRCVRGRGDYLLKIQQLQFLYCPVKNLGFMIELASTI